MAFIILYNDSGIFMIFLIMHPIVLWRGIINMLDKIIVSVYNIYVTFCGILFPSQLPGSICFFATRLVCCNALVMILCMLCLQNYQAHFVALGILKKIYINHHQSFIFIER